MEIPERKEGKHDASTPGISVPGETKNDDEHKLIIRTVRPRSGDDLDVYDSGNLQDVSFDKLLYGRPHYTDREVVKTVVALGKEIPPRDEGEMG